MDKTQRYLRRKEYVDNWRKTNSEKVKVYSKRYKDKQKLKDGYLEGITPGEKALKAWMIELKSKPCTDCKQKFPVCCMDFDHRQGTIKSYNIGSMFAHHYSRELIHIELDKCELVCSNCHRIRTRDRRTGKSRKELAVDQEENRKIEKAARQSKSI